MSLGWLGGSEMKAGNSCLSLRGLDPSFMGHPGLEDQLFEETIYFSSVPFFYGIILLLLIVCFKGRSLLGGYLISIPLLCSTYHKDKYYVLLLF